MRHSQFLLVAILGLVGCSDDGSTSAEPATLAGSDVDDFVGPGLTRPTVTSDEVARFCEDVDAFLASGATSPDELLDLGVRSSNLQFGRGSLDSDDQERLDDCLTRLAEPFSR